jgi:peptidoglycan biosynthesis protein MviN/MurJ (putative lipid II flippase)
VGPLEIRGLALGLSLAALLEFGVVFWLLARRLPAVASSETLAGLGLMCLAAGLMATVAGFSFVLLEQVGELDMAATLPALVALAMVGATASLTYLLATLWLGCEEPRILLARLHALAARLWPSR